MIHYEVFVTGKSNPFHIFESFYQFQLNERIFVKIDDVLDSLIVTKITHDITGHKHVVRLNCQLKKYIN